MTDNDILIRPAVPEDAGRLLEIYSYYVEKTAISFEWDVPSLEEFTGRMTRIRQRHPYLAAEKDGKIIGYAYASDLISRAAYDWCCELTIYLDHSSTKQGAGGKLCRALESELKDMGYLNLYACIAVPEMPDEYLTDNSIRFHEHMGFRKIGTFTHSGYKFGRWYHMVWAEKIIGEHTADPKHPGSL